MIVLAEETVRQGGGEDHGSLSLLRGREDHGSLSLLVVAHFFEEKDTELVEIQVLVFEVEEHSCSFDLVCEIVAFSNFVEEGVLDGVVQGESEERIELQQLFKQVDAVGGDSPEPIGEVDPFLGLEQR